MMKFTARFLLLFAMVGIYTTPAWALITTDNTDPNEFAVKQTLQYATYNCTVSMSGVRVPAAGTSGANVVEDIVLPFKGSIVGMSMAFQNAITAGGVTAEVAINRTGTGIQCAADCNTARTATGAAGSTGTQFAYVTQPRGKTRTVQGFRAESDEQQKHNTANPYGYTTPIAAGDRINVLLTTTNNLAPLENDVLITVEVLQ